MPTSEIKKTAVTGLEGTMQGLKELSTFAPTETEIPSLGPLPKEEDFIPQDIGKGIKLARAASILAAGLQDPNLAAAMMQSFQQKDLAARESAQLAYRNALGVAVEKRQEEQFKIVEGRQQRAEQTDVANVRLRALEASLQATSLQLRVTDDPEKQAQHLNTIAELQALRDAIVGPQSKPLQFKSPMEAAMAFPKEMGEAIRAGKGVEMMTQLNQQLMAEAPSPKAIVSKEQFQSILSSAADPAARTYIEAVFATAPDTRTDMFGSPQESLTWASSLRKLMETDPAKFEESVQALANSYVASGMVQDLESAETFIADVVSKRADPEHDARIQPPGTFKVKPPEVKGRGATGSFAGPRTITKTVKSIFGAGKSAGEKPKPPEGKP